MMVVGEGDTDLPYLRKLADDAGLPATSDIDAGGKGNIDRDLAKYNAMGKSLPLLVVRDLDRDAKCAGELVSGMRRKPARWFRFRLAVRELESWVLADAVGLARFLGVEKKWIPEDPDSEADPTQSLLAVAGRAPAQMRRKLLPEKGNTAVVGPLYEATLIEFGTRVWSAARASERSPSLRRARVALEILARDWRRYVSTD